MINTIKYHDEEESFIVVEYNDHNQLYPSSYRDDEINTWLETHTIEPWTDPTDYQELMRLHRNSLLTECDWTQLQDVDLTPEEVTAWQEYRQDLRDFPNEHPEVETKAQYDALVWPTPPE